ncbi:MAG: inorganic phosphate transporter [Nitrospinae bacterium]|nr:inorganic phosphate transporter [Nitrospinota bacterium]
MEFLILFIIVLFLSYANGSNDVSKGIATLVGSGVANYQKAILWGIVWTAIGSLASAMISVNMLTTFGKGFVTDTVFNNFDFLFSITAGASVWVILASGIGMPVSTTHAIVGAMVGAGLVFTGWDGVMWGSVFNKIFIPLLLSPLLSFTLTFIIFRLIKIQLYEAANYCLCLESRQNVFVQCSKGDTALSTDTGEVGIVVDEEKVCNNNFVTTLRLNLLDIMHWISSGFVCMTRGLNDTPKIAVIILSSSLFTSPWIFFFLTLAMTIGGYLYGMKTTETLSFKITKMNHTEGFTSNLVTAILVGSASYFGLPVSTTHVSSSAIIACGFKKGGGYVDKKIVNEILLAWLVTVPASAMFSTIVYLILRTL